jgi:hypothetical protein
MMTHAFPFQRTREIQVVPSQYTCSNVLPGTRYHPGCLGMVEAGDSNGLGFGPDSPTISGVEGFA